MKDLRVFFEGDEVGRLRIDSISGDLNGNITVMETYKMNDRQPETMDNQLKISLATEFMKLPSNLGEIIDWATENNCSLIVEDVAGKAATEVYVGDVTAFVSTSPLTAGTTSVAYSEEIEFSATTGAGVVSLISGTLPTGLTLSNNVISGTPSVANSFTFTLRLSDANYPSIFVDEEFTIVVS